MTQDVLQQLQHDSFDYFLYEANPDNGLVIDKTAPNWPASIAATGLALAAYPIGVERGYMSRAATWIDFRGIQDAFMREKAIEAFFNPTYPSQDGDPNGWVSPWHFGINQGPIILMIENYLSGMVWRLTRQCPYLVTGLRRAGLAGGWL